MSEKLRILLLEDRRTDAELVLGELSQQGIRCEAKRVMTEREFLEQLRLFEPDVVLADYSLPTYDGLSALSAVRKLHPELPFIFVSGTLGEERAIEALHCGATDYVLKDRMSRLGPAVRRALAETQERRGRARAEAQIHELNLLLRAIRSINQLIVREREPEKLLVKACEILVQTRGYVFAWVGVPEADSKRVVLAAQAGKGGGYLEAITVTWDEAPTGRGPVGTAMRTGQPWVCQDTAADPRFAAWKGLALARGFASIAAVPMMQGARALGVLTVYSNRSEAFVEGEIQLLSELAADLSFALQSIEHENERKRAEESLRASEVRYRRLFEAAKDGVLILDAVTGMVLDVNPFLVELLGYSREAFLGRKIWELGFFKDVVANQASFAELQEKGYIRYEDKPLETADGRRVEVEFVSNVYLANHHQVIQCNIRDISERKRGERALRALSSRQEAILAAVPDLIMEVDTRKVYTWANQTGLDFFGGDVIGKEAAYYFEGEQAIYESVQPLFRGDQTVIYVESWQRRKDGEKRLLAWWCRVLKDEQGRVTGALSSARDITEHKRAEAALRESEEQFRAMFEVASVGMAQADPRTGRWLRVNQKMCAITGYSAADLLKMRVPDITHPEDRQRDWEAFARVVRGEAPDYRLEKRYLRKDGTVAWVNVNMTVIRDAGGRPARTMATIEDITERKQLETQLLQAQRMEAIGQLAGGVAHDFNNMLAVIRGNADLLLTEADELSAGARECLKQIAGASDRAASLTRQLLIFSRKQVMQPQAVLLNDLIKNLSKMLVRTIREDIRLECIYGDELPYVQGDPAMLEQVVLNLVVNARDAMPGGGQLRIASEKASLGAGQAQASPEARAGEFVCLSVSDSGTGIAPEHLPRIFEPFFTTKEPGKGTGLGLATVYGVVKRHEGWVEVRSQVGEGTTVRVFLPATPPPAKVEAAPVAEAKVRGGTETILLVEDEESVRSTTRRVLESFGYKVWEASCAREAMEVWGQRGGEIALLITDMMMPEGVNGRDLAEQLRAQRPGLKVIFMSGYSAEALGKDTQFFWKTKSCFLRKPCATDHLVRTVRQCLDEKQ
jgi:two-component system, cell cycle sensor histidine kinase and response regulator CckA